HVLVPTMTNAFVYAAAFGDRLAGTAGSHAWRDLVRPIVLRLLDWARLRGHGLRLRPKTSTPLNDPGSTWAGDGTRRSGVSTPTTVRAARAARVTPALLGYHA